MYDFKYKDIVDYFSSNDNCEFTKDNKTYFLKISGVLYSIDKELDIFGEEKLSSADIIKKFVNKIRLVNDKRYSFSNDWKIVFSDIVNIIRINSKKLDKNLDIPIKYFIDFLNDNNISKLTNSLEDVLFGRVVIFDKNHNLYVEDNLYEKEEILIDKDLIVGGKYLLCDNVVTYLGERYISELLLDKYIRFDRVSDISKKRFVLTNNNEVKFVNSNLEEVNYNDIASLEDCDKVLKEYFDNNFSLVYFSKKDFNDTPEYGFIESDAKESPFIKIGKSFFTKVQNSNNIKGSSRFKKGDRNYSFEFKLDLNGKSFNSVTAIPLDINDEDIALQRIGIINN